MSIDDYVIGVDLGGTKIYTALASNKGDILAEIKIFTQASYGPEHVIRRIVRTVEQVQIKAGLRGKVNALGIGAPGPLDPVRGIVYQAPNLGWRDLPLKKILEDKTQIPAAIDNDANLAALGEHVFGAGRGVEDMVYVTVSTGIGGGLILGGKLYYGTGFGAGELGHMTVEPDGPKCRCGNRGCLEALASGTAMARQADEFIEQGRGRGILKIAGEKNKVSSQIVAQAAAAGDQEALDILTAAGRYLGIALANIINILNPTLILLGGGAAQAGEPLWQAIRGELEKRALSAACQQAEIMPAALGQRSGLMGAIALAIRSQESEFRSQNERAGKNI